MLTLEASLPKIASARVQCTGIVAQAPVIWMIPCIFSNNGYVRRPFQAFICQFRPALVSR
jgi:hypothetical protein